MGLCINEDKTKYMCANRTQRRDRLGQNMSIGQYNFERVQRLKYLGATVTADNNIAEEIKGRIQSGNRCVFALAKLLSSKSLSRTSKIRIYKTVIRPVVTYGSETWTITKENEHKLRRFERKVLRKIYGLLYDQTTGGHRIRKNRELEELYKDPDIVKEIKSQRLKWAGHVKRQKDSRIIKLSWEAVPPGKRPLGRPRMRWRDNINTDLKTMNVEPDQAETLMLDREGWKEIVRLAKTRPGL